MTRFFDVRSVSTNLAAPTTAAFKTYNRLNGAVFDYVTQGQIEVTIKFSIRSDTLSILDDLNRILHTKEPKKLYFEDRPDRYLMAVYTGDASMNRRYYGTTSTLTFISPDSYWRSTSGPKTISAIDGRFFVANNGTAPTYPRLEYKFKSESGYLGVIAPNGILLLGTKEEMDRVKLPTQEIVMNEEMDSESMVDDGGEGDVWGDWVKIISNTYDIKTNFEDGTVGNIKGEWIPDYKKLNMGSGTTKHTQWGMSLAKSTTPKPGYYWNSYGYYRVVDKGVDQSTHSIKTNWRLESRVTLYDASGKTTPTGMFLIVVMDVRNRPIMTTSIYNVLNNSNEVTITGKINDRDGISKSSKIVKTANFPNGFDGLIKMETDSRGYIKWSWSTTRDQKVITKTKHIEKFVNGNTVYIRKDAKYGYSHDGTRHNIASFTRGRPHKVTGTRVHSGKKQYLISYSGSSIYWMNEGDLTANASGVGKTVTQQVRDGEKDVSYSMYAPKIADMRAHKVVVIGGTWDNTEAFSGASINSVKMFRVNGENSWLEINNTFQKDDVVVIDNKTGEILLNGVPFDGVVDYDSKFFDIDYGETEVRTDVSNWAIMPEGKIIIEERFR